MVRVVRPATIAFLLTAGVVQADALAQGPVPDTGGTAATRAAGMPLRDGALAPGTLTVRIVRGSFDRNAPHETVQIEVGGRVERAITGTDGRAQFAHLPIGATVQATAVVDGEALSSERFEMAAESGIRVLLVAGEGAATASGVPAGAPSSVPESVPAAASVAALRPANSTADEDVVVVGIRALFATATIVALALVVFGRFGWRPLSRSTGADPSADQSADR